MKRLTFFVVPRGATSMLTEDGWMFDAKVPLPQHLVGKLVDHMGAIFAEEYLGIQQFRTADAQIDVISNAAGAVNEISIRTTKEDFLEDLCVFLQNEPVAIFDAAGRRA